MGTNSNSIHCSPHRNRQEAMLQTRRTYHPSSGIQRPSDTPTSFRSKEFQQYLSSFHSNANASRRNHSTTTSTTTDVVDNAFEHPHHHPPIGNMYDRFESVLDRPFRYWKALDQVLEYSYPEWLTNQRGRMIHHLIHFLELKIGFQDYNVNPPTPPSRSFFTTTTDNDDDLQSRDNIAPPIGGGGQLMPSPVVDEAWRALVLESELYEKITRHLQEFHGQPCYQYIHYSRVKRMMNYSSRSSGRRQAIPEQLKTTQSLFQDYFHEFMPASIRQVRTTKPIRSSIPASRYSRAKPSRSSSSSLQCNTTLEAAQQRHDQLIQAQKSYHLGNNDLTSPASASLLGLQVLNGIEKTPTNNNNNKHVLWC
mmetsp:Transcript_5679/g.13382  ORF Transcript_5679/g.13382 Transcript_5679/m.13382 type:complete len:365 (+) Transcript_5679:289-1383(+)